jgi:hypothetical protein
MHVASPYDLVEDFNPASGLVLWPDNCADYCTHHFSLPQKP